MVAEPATTKDRIKPIGIPFVVPPLLLFTSANNKKFRGLKKID